MKSIHTVDDGNKLQEDEDRKKLEPQLPAVFLIDDINMSDVGVRSSASSFKVPRTLEYRCDNRRFERHWWQHSIGHGEVESGANNNTTSSMPLIQESTVLEDFVRHYEQPIYQQQEIEEEPSSILLAFRDRLLEQDRTQSTTTTHSLIDEYAVVIRPSLRRRSSTLISASAVLQHYVWLVQELLPPNASCWTDDWWIDALLADASALPSFLRLLSRRPIAMTIVLLGWVDPWSSFESEMVLDCAYPVLNEPLKVPLPVPQQQCFVEDPPEEALVAWDSVVVVDVDAWIPLVEHYYFRPPTRTVSRLHLGKHITTQEAQPTTAASENPKAMRALTNLVRHISVCTPEQWHGLAPMLQHVLMAPNDEGLGARLVRRLWHEGLQNRSTILGMLTQNVRLCRHGPALVETGWALRTLYGTTVEARKQILPKWLFVVERNPTNVDLILGCLQGGILPLLIDLAGTSHVLEVGQYGLSVLLPLLSSESTEVQRLALVALVHLFLAAYPVLSRHGGSVMSALLACIGDADEELALVGIKVAAVALVVCQERATAILDHVEQSGDYEDRLVEIVGTIRLEAAKVPKES